MGKKFTGGNIVTRNFEALTDARRWIFGDAQNLKTVTMSAIDLRRMAGSVAFEVSPAEIAEADGGDKQMSIRGNYASRRCRLRD